MTGLGKNRVTEKDLRDWLNENGYVGQFAKIEELELFAIKPPGWRQVFQFSVEVRRREDSTEGADRPWMTYHGVIVDDERNDRGNQTQVFIFEGESQRQAKLEEVSDGMIQQGREKLDFRVTVFLVAMFALFLVFIVVLQRWMG